MIQIILLSLVAYGLLRWQQSRASQERIAQYSEVLEKYFAYYRSLDSTQKEQFMARIEAFLTEKMFVSRGQLIITSEMKVLVAACAVQLSFGLSTLYLSYFKTIILYPDKYYSILNQNYHVGEVNAGGRNCIILEALSGGIFLHQRLAERGFA